MCSECNLIQHIDNYLNDTSELNLVEKSLIVCTCSKSKALSHAFIHSVDNKIISIVKLFLKYNIDVNDISTKNLKLFVINNHDCVLELIKIVYMHDLCEKIIDLCWMYLNEHELLIIILHYLFSQSKYNCKYHKLLPAFISDYNLSDKIKLFTDLFSKNIIDLQSINPEDITTIFNFIR